VHRPGDAGSAGKREARGYTPREAGHVAITAGLSIELFKEEVQAEREIEARAKHGLQGLQVAKQSVLAA
jgi:hypothetical protein